MKLHNLAFIDTETTGTDPNLHEIIELAVIIARQVPREGKGPKLEIIEECEWKIKMVHPEKAEEQALRVNGYNEVDWMFAIDRKKAMEEFAKKTQSCSFVSHNLVFDYNFITKAFDETGVDNRMHYAKIDTISLAFARLYDAPQADKFSLRYLCELLKSNVYCLSLRIHKLSMRRGWIIVCTMPRLILSHLRLLVSMMLRRRINSL